jgi:hypothetical protein
MIPRQLGLLVREPRPVRRDVALRRPAPPGAERLLRELVRRGLEPGALRVAAGLCLALDGQAAATRGGAA